jgi:hypothetical protein
MDKNNEALNLKCDITHPEPYRIVIFGYSRLLCLDRELFLQVYPSPNENTAFLSC